LVAELSFASKTEVARDALRWFIVQHSNLDILERAAKILNALKEHHLRKTLALCLCDYLALCDPSTGSFDEDEDSESRDLADDLLSSARNENSPLSTILSEIICDEAEQLDIRMTCSIGLAVFDPEECVRVVANIVERCPVTSEPFLLETFEPGFRRAVDEILESYFNSRSLGMCPSYLDSLEGDESARLEEYSRLHDACRAGIFRFGYTDEALELENLLSILNPERVRIKRRPDFRIQPCLNFRPIRPYPL